MKKTKVYKLNLIEPSDPFLPDGLNANTQQVEDVLRENLEGMDQRVTALEARKVYFGSYWNTAGDYIFHVDLPFTPKCVIVQTTSGQAHTLMSTSVGEYGHNASLTLREGGFDAFGSGKYAFIAFC